MKVHLASFDALIVVDVQSDFLPGGALEIPKGDKVIQPLNNYIRLFSTAGNPVYFTRDWHCRDHLSFQPNGGLWPPHCIADTPGAAFPQELKLPSDNKFIISKGTTREFDAYSGFQGTQLLGLLQERGIKRVFIGGLATDYCVKNTVIGALNFAFTTIVLLDACRGVDATPGNSDRAVDAMLSSGAIIITSPDLAG